MTTAATRLSLFKLFLPTTDWVSISRAEHLDLLAWLRDKRSQTGRRNAYDALFETFIWFPTGEAHVLVPLGHLTRARRQAMPSGNPPRAGRYVPSVLLNWGWRQPTPGDEVLRVRLALLGLEGE